MKKHHMVPLTVHNKTGHRVVHTGKGAKEDPTPGHQTSLFDTDHGNRSSNVYAKRPGNPAPSQPDMDRTPTAPQAPAGASDGSSDMMDYDDAQDGELSVG